MANRKPRETEVDESAAYRRRSRPVRVRRGVLDWRSWPWRKIVIGAAAAALSVSTIYALDGFMRRAEDFRFDSDTLGVSGLERLPEESITKLFDDDFGLSLLDVDVAARREQMLAIPWVRTATISRLWPNRLWVAIEERQPVAYARFPPAPDGKRATRLVDADGVLLERLPGMRLDLAVIDGIGPEMRLSERAPRVGVYLRLLDDLDSQEPHYSPLVSQINVSDPHNARITTLHQGDVIELIIGKEHFRHRFSVFLEQAESWKQQFGAIGWIDLSLKGQVVVQPFDQARQTGRPTADAN